MSISIAHGLTIPEWVLTQKITWAARLVLSEVLNLYKVKGQVWAEDDYFVDRLDLSKRIVGQAIKELADARLLHRDTKQNRRHKRILTPSLDGLPVAESATGKRPDLLQNPQEPLAESATGLLQDSQEAIAESATLNSKLNREGKTNQSKTGAGADFSQNSSSPAESLITAPTPVAAPPAPAADDADEARAFVKQMAPLWKVSEAKNFQSWAKLTRFALALAAQGKLAELREQFAGFRDFFTGASLTPHNLDKFTGHEGQAPPYSLGTWCECDWPAKAADRKPVQPQGPPEKAERSSASPSKPKPSWR
ncbi:hypothetical protein Q5H92_08845 [Hymenobacter sp. M29]|uniref:Helix-turn-helix domain-containing protein n=1 Tax=Hymenobacter mellowenesis TaxID=3063995 RepID=A0ABT9A9E4_9BACT|nr:hypothetical protein [Hymenobacter sp. M29]MDO7846462.1 hypothetical protein [Hymenobacter sp. M29]